MNTWCLLKLTRLAWMPFAAACALCALPPAASAAVRYVDLNSTNPGGDYDTWETAAHEIQTALDSAHAAGVTVVEVAPGVYDRGGRAHGGSQIHTNSAYIHAGITLRSRDNDPATTIIMGAMDPASTNIGPAAVRGVYMLSNA